MTTICKTADNITAINNAHFQLTSAIGGRKIANATVACCAGDEWDDEIANRETFTNAKVLKQSREFNLCDRKGELGPFLAIPLSKIERYAYEVNGKNIDVRIFDGFSWRINLEMA